MVLVSTHLDKDHLHNHFCICAVSPFDGKRFNNEGKTKWEMRDASDRLCKKHGLSVIKDPKGYRYSNYGEWRAAKLKGEETHRSMLYRDIDNVIAHSVSEEEFYSNLKKLGYRIIVRGNSISVGYPFWERNIRLNRDKNGYSLDEIRARIYSNVRTKPPFRPYSLRMIKIKGRKKFSHTFIGKPFGLIAVYYHYCHALGVFEHHQHQSYHTPPGLRAEINKMNVLFDEVSLLARNKINTADELNYYRSTLINKKAFLISSREALRNKNNQSISDSQRIEIKADISKLTKKIRILTKQITLCDDISSHSRQRKEALDKELNRQFKEAEKDRDYHNNQLQQTKIQNESSLRRNK